MYNQDADDLSTVLIVRPCRFSNGPIQRYPELDAISFASVIKLKQIYQVERRTLGLYVPKEDMEFQEKHGGTDKRPVLVGMVGKSNTPLLIPADRSLIMFRNLPEFVIPLFTSRERLKKFKSQLKARGCVIPEHRVKTFVLNPGIYRQLKNGEVIINPIPEFCLTAYMIFSIEMDGSAGITMAGFHEEDLLRLGF